MSEYRVDTYEKQQSDDGKVKRTQTSFIVVNPCLNFSFQIGVIVVTYSIRPIESDVLDSVPSCLTVRLI
jgi:hypothetical protein